MKHPVDLPVPTVLQQEVYVPQDPGSPEEEESREKKPASQGKSGGRKETYKRDSKEKKDRSGPRVRGLRPALSPARATDRNTGVPAQAVWVGGAELPREQAGSLSLLGLSSNPSSSTHFAGCLPSSVLPLYTQLHSVVVAGIPFLIIIFTPA